MAFTALICMKTHKCWTTWSADLLYQISQKSVPKYGKYAQILIYTPYVKCGFDCVNFNETHNQSVISCTQFYPKYTKNVWCTGKHSFTPVSKVWLLSWFSMKIWQRISCSQMEIYSLHIRHFLQVHKAHLLKLCLSTHIPVMKWPTTALSRQLLRLSQQCCCGLRSSDLNLKNIHLATSKVYSQHTECGMW